MTAVMIGIDPAKRSRAMAVLDEREGQLAALQVGNDSAGYRDMIRLARRWPERTWAVEGDVGPLHFGGGQTASVVSAVRTPENLGEERLAC